MPIYEYLCKDCGLKSSFLILRVQEAFEPKCKHCSSTRLKKLLSKVNIPKSEEKRLESLADPSKFSDFNEDDPKSMARLLKHMGKEMGEDVGENIDQAVDEAMESDESGEHGED